VLGVNGIIGTLGGD